MALRLDVKKQLVQKTDRIKAVDLHPTEPWLLASLFTGVLHIWDHNRLILIKSFEVTDRPVRAAKFIARKQWVVCGADDQHLHVYDYNTMDKVKQFEAHPKVGRLEGWIRSIAVHPMLPYVLTSGDDCMIKLWDWDKDWACCQVFEGHYSYVMQVVFNPVDPNMFASASLDRTVKVWSLGQPQPSTTLWFNRPVNCVDYCRGGDGPLLVAGADDGLIKVWDCQTKQCVHTVQGHAHHVTAIAFHPELPIIVSASEDGTIKTWDATKYWHLSTLNCGLRRSWAVGVLKGSTNVAFGFDEGMALVNIGPEDSVLSLNVEKQLVQKTHRVKAVDFHPTEPWLLASLHTGVLCVWDYNNLNLIKSFEVTNLPVRAAKFIARKQWVVCGADDGFLRVYNYCTAEKFKLFQAHTNWIRSIAMHPVLPYVLTSADDKLIKCWDWSKNWTCCQVFKGHSDYVMQVVFNPVDTNSFASASRDCTVKVWSLGQCKPNFTLEGHRKCVNCVDYITGGDRPFLVAGADDGLIKVWDCQTKLCVHTVQGHAHHVTAIAFHPELPIIVSASEEGTIKMWDATTYRLENTLNYGMERPWAVGVLKGSNRVALGFDDGVSLAKIEWVDQAGGQAKDNLLCAEAIDDEGKATVAAGGWVVV